MKKIIIADVTSTLSQLSVSENEYSGKEKKNPTSLSSTNGDKTVRLKIILKEAKK